MKKLRAIWRAYSDAAGITLIMLLSLETFSLHTAEILLIWAVSLIAVITWKVGK